MGHACGGTEVNRSGTGRLVQASLKPTIRAAKRLDGGRSSPAKGAFAKPNELGNQDILSEVAVAGTLAEDDIVGTIVALIFTAWG